MNPAVLFVTSECAPLVKTGGLADVAGALPLALRLAGVDARVLLPGYPAVLAGLDDATEVARIAAFAELPEAHLLAATLNGVPTWVVRAPSLYERDGGPYVDATGADWPDNPRRFALLGRMAALLASSVSPVDWRADVLHANDWQAGLGPAYLALLHDRAAASITTVHNLAFQGVFDPAWLARLGLPASSWSIEGVEYYGRLGFLKAGLYYADAITTVSPTYAREILTAPLGMGLEGLLANRRARLHGILNGIDVEAWNPSRDPRIPRRYDAGSLPLKAENKAALQQRFGLARRADVPIFGCVTRLTHQKGIDVVAEIASTLASLPAQLVVLGTGERAEEDRLRQLASAHPEAIGVRIGFDEDLAHLIEAGADAFLMPSRFEPCGMNQMYSQRYGTPPIVHATGGLADSVVGATPATLADGSATGFAFRELDAATLLATIRHAIDAWRDPARWQAIQRAGMARDFSWGSAAARYAAVYREVLRRQ
jgi:starch synthase